jgi:hypothetical protein
MAKELLKLRSELAEARKTGEGVAELKERVSQLDAKLWETEAKLDAEERKHKPAPKKRAKTWTM